MMTVQIGRAHDREEPGHVALVPRGRLLLAVTLRHFLGQAIEEEDSQPRRRIPAGIGRRPRRGPRGPAVAERLRRRLGFA